MTNLSFSISGDFITNLARQWFWQENKPFHEVYQLLDQTLCTGDMLSTMEKHRIITDILEYRSDLHGTDVFTLIDHLPKEDYTSIFTRIQTLEKELMIERIKNDMQYSFQNTSTNGPLLSAYIQMLFVNEIHKHTMIGKCI